MKKGAFLIAVLLLLNSCSATYYQLYTVDTTSNNHHSTEKVECFSTNECTISYNFWSRGGNSSFIVTNNTDELITVNVDECYFVHNGLMTYYFGDRIFSNSSRLSTTLTTGNSLAVSQTKSIAAGRIGTVTMTSATTQALTESATYIKEPRSLTILPHASVVIEGFSINDYILTQCGFSHTPSASKKLFLSLIVLHLQ